MLLFTDHLAHKGNKEMIKKAERMFDEAKKRRR